MARFEWSTQARDGLRAIPRDHALAILADLHRWTSTGAGDVSALSGDWAGWLRLRSGDYRLIFRHTQGDSYRVELAGHRRDVYR